jgi:hypothetical protein
VWDEYTDPVHENTFSPYYDSGVQFDAEHPSEDDISAALDTFGRVPDRAASIAALRHRFDANLGRDIRE